MSIGSSVTMEACPSPREDTLSADYDFAEMRSTRRACALIGIAAVALVVTLPAAAKDGVRATLTTRIPVRAPAGTQLKVGWTLAYRDLHGGRHLFGGGGVFVRLVSATGAGAETTYVRCSGRCSATVRVPKGGIRDIQIGIRGYSTTGPGDMLFAITNDPVPG